MIYTTAMCTVKTPDFGQRNCPKHVEFYSIYKIKKLVHLFGFIIRILVIVNCALLMYVFDVQVTVHRDKFLL